MKASDLLEKMDEMVYPHGYTRDFAKTVFASLLVLLEEAQRDGGEIEFDMTQEEIMRWCWAGREIKK